MSHLKRLLAPKYWKINKKEFTWTVSPSPGPHKKSECIPLLIIVRDILKIVDTAKEAKSIISRGEILVDGKPRKNYKYPTGLFDVISIPKIGKYYRIVPYKNGFKLVEIPEAESKLKILKINNITAVKGGKFQLNLNDGKNILVEKKNYSTGDSILVEVPSLKIIKHLPLKKGSLVVATKGRMSGRIGRVEEIKEGKFKTPAKLICDIEGKKVEVLKEHAIVVGEEKPEISLGE